MELLVVRHALPVRVEDADGPADPPLSDLGRRQAEALAEWLEPEGIDAVVSSPLRRALETAAPLVERTGLSLEVDEGVVEWDRSSNRYVPIEELALEDDPHWRAMRDGRWSDLGVDIEAFRSRVSAAFEAIVAAHPGRRVVVVCHGGVVNALASSVIGLPAPVFFRPTYTGITRVLASRHGDRMLSSLDETPHLRGIGAYEPGPEPSPSTSSGPAGRSPDPRLPGPGAGASSSGGGS